MIFQIFLMVIIHLDKSYEVWNCRGNSILWLPYRLQSSILLNKIANCITKRLNFVIHGVNALLNFRFGGQFIPSLQKLFETFSFFFFWMIKP